MPGSPIQVGPFVGGLNTFSDATAIADNELVVCENFELDLDGSLKSRPPIEDLGIDFPLQATGDIEFLGVFKVSSTVSYLIASDGLSKTYYFNGTAWVQITNTIAAAGFIQFDDKAWLTAPVGSANPGGYWTVAGGFVADSNMPKGNLIVTFKDRLWIAEGQDSTNEGTRLYRSRTVADPSLWQVTNDFIDIGVGDGQNIVQLVVYFNTLMIFRINSVYGLQYTSDPAAATVSLILPTVGLSSRYAITQFESYIYFMYDEKAYEFTNNRAAQINVKTPFKSTVTTGFHNNYAVSEFNRRIIFTYFDQMFVYSLQTRSWTQWKSTVYGSLCKMAYRANDQDKSIVLTHKNIVVPAGVLGLPRYCKLRMSTALSKKQWNAKFKQKTLTTRLAPFLSGCFGGVWTPRLRELSKVPLSRLLNLSLCRGRPCSTTKRGVPCWLTHGVTPNPGHRLLPRQ
jgi:hypothetical protein